MHTWALKTRRQVFMAAHSVTVMNYNTKSNTRENVVSSCKGRLYNRENKEVEERPCMNLRNM